GELKWQYQFPSNSLYIGGPTSMADINNDGFLEVVFSDWFQVGAVNYWGDLLWSYDIPGYGQSFRGIALGDINGDQYPDLTFCSSGGTVIGLRGESGNFIQQIDLLADYGAENFEVEHGPLIADFNNDGTLDVFVAGGHAEYPAIENNFGRAYMVSWGDGNGPDWKMFRRDYRRSACICNDSLLVSTPTAIQNIPEWTQLQLYPNPANTFVEITLDALHAHTITVSDLSGNRLQSFTAPSGTASLDVRQYSAGVYFIQTESVTGKASGFFIKQ
ncbi:MAG: T9SS type A sorting domain-containing protein, partial [Chitinophagales bacterium]